MDSGGGCMLWIIDSIFKRVRNKRIRKYNIQARGIEEYKSTSSNILFPQHTYKEGVIISGGSITERLSICETLIRNAYNAKHPVVILHTGNGMMENVVARNGFGIIINDRSKLFDAFTALDFNEIVQIVTDTCKSKYDIKPSGRYILQIVYELLSCLGRKPYFSAFASCPYFKLSDQIQTRLTSGAITQSDADKLNSLLMTGQVECPKIDTFFNDMKSQINFISANDPQSVNTVSVLSSIINNQLLCIDIKSSTNVMFMELIVNSLIIAMNRGYDFTLMIDEIPFVNNDMLKNTLSQKSNHRNIIVSKDLYALTGGREDVFSTIIGEVEKTVLFSHSSSISCEKWSKYIGEYEKIDVAQNVNSGWNQSSKWGYNTNYGQTETLKKESKVKSEDINRLSQSEAIIYDHSTGSLIQTIVA